MYNKHSKIYGYADDTTSSCKGKNWKDIIKNLEEDAIDAARLWNQLPSNIKVSTTINQAKNSHGLLKSNLFNINIVAQAMLPIFFVPPLTFLI